MESFDAKSLPQENFGSFIRMDGCFSEEFERIRSDYRKEYNSALEIVKRTLNPFKMQMILN